MNNDVSNAQAYANELLQQQMQASYATMHDAFCSQSRGRVITQGAYNVERLRTLENARLVYARQLEADERHAAYMRNLVEHTDATIARIRGEIEGEHQAQQALQNAAMGAGTFTPVRDVLTQAWGALRNGFSDVPRYPQPQEPAHDDEAHDEAKELVTV